MFGWLLLILLVLILIAALPTWPYSGGWGYYPSGIVAAVLIILLVMLLFGWFPTGRGVAPVEPRGPDVEIEIEPPAVPQPVPGR